MLPLRYALNLFSARREASAYGDRTLRESSTLRAAAEVWSDVASSAGLGYRTTDGAPLLYGDLPSGAQLEVSVYETKDTGEYRTVATARPASPRPGRLIVRAHDPWTRVLSRALRPPPGVPRDIGARFFVRASPVELAAELLDEAIARALVALADRRPRLSWEDGEVELVLEGVELVHERLEILVAALSALTAPRDGTSILDTPGARS